MEENSSLINQVQTHATPRSKHTRGLLLAIAGVLLLVVTLSTFTTKQHSFSTDGIQDQVEDVVEIIQTNLFYKYTLGEEYICADGSPYVFYIRRPNATSPNYNKWVVTQEGTGRQCEDQESCDEKYLEFDGYYMSSNGMPGCMTREPEGGLNSVQEEYNTRFHDYSLVWIHSCNGDDSLGQARAGENGNPTTWHWTGSINMWATFEHLIQNFIIDPDSILVAGPDTAGISFVNQLNKLDEYWTKHYPDVPIHFIADGGWNDEEYLCYDEDTCEHFLGDVALRYESQNPAVHPDCADQYGEKCYYVAEYASAFMDPATLNKTIFVLSFFDTRFLSEVAAFAAPDDWKLERANHLMDTINDHGVLNMFATSCPNHVQSNKRDWYRTYNEEFPDMSPMEAVYLHTMGETVWNIDEILIVDDTDMRCGRGQDQDWVGSADDDEPDICDDVILPDWYVDTLDLTYNQTWVSVQHLIDSIQ